MTKIRRDFSSAKKAPGVYYAGLKVIMKTKMTNRSKGESYLVYQKWEGTLAR